MEKRWRVKEMRWREKDGCWKYEWIERIRIEKDDEEEEEELWWMLMGKIEEEGEVKEMDGLVKELDEDIDEWNMFRNWGMDIGKDEGS